MTIKSLTAGDWRGGRGILTSDSKPFPHSTLGTSLKCQFGVQSMSIPCQFHDNCCQFAYSSFAMSCQFLSPCHGFDMYLLTFTVFSNFAWHHLSSLYQLPDSLPLNHSFTLSLFFATNLFYRWVIGGAVKWCSLASNNINFVSEIKRSRLFRWL